MEKLSILIHYWANTLFGSSHQSVVVSGRTYRNQISTFQINWIKYNVIWRKRISIIVEIFLNLPLVFSLNRCASVWIMCSHKKFANCKNFLAKLQKKFPCEILIINKISANKQNINIFTVVYWKTHFFLSNFQMKLH